MALLGKGDGIKISPTFVTANQIAFIPVIVYLCEIDSLWSDCIIFQRIAPFYGFVHSSRRI